MSRWLKIGLGIFAILLLIQLIPVNRSVPAVAPETDFLVYANTPENIGKLIKTACYDCHSYETKYPWYAKVAPVSFWIQHHVNEGREHLNFATWTTYDIGKQFHKMEESIEEIEEGHMPFPNYIRLHSEAKWTATEEEQVLGYFRGWMEALR